MRVQSMLLILSLLALLCVSLTAATKVSEAANALVAKTNAVQVPDDPASYLEFLSAVKAAEDQIGASSLLPKESV